MPIPDYQTLMRPVLELHADGAEHATKTVVAVMADKFGLTDEERAELLPSGRQTTIANRVHWAVTYLVQACLLERPRRAVSVITERGKDLLASTTKSINVKVLEQFPEFQAFRARTKKKAGGAGSAEAAEESSPPAEAIPALVAEPMRCLPAT
jgi:restriction system protein